MLSLMIGSLRKPSSFRCLVHVTPNWAANLSMALSPTLCRVRGMSELHKPTICNSNGKRALLSVQTKGNKDKKV